MESCGADELKHGIQAENGIIYASNMSGEMHMEGRQDAQVRYSAAYPTGAERCHDLSDVDDVTGSTILSSEGCFSKFNFVERFEQWQASFA